MNSENNGTPPSNLNGRELVEMFMKEMRSDADKRNNEQLTQLEKRIEDKWSSHISALEAKYASLPIVKGLHKEDAAKFSFAKLVKGILSRDMSDCGYEADLCREAAKTVGKDMSTTTDSAGGFIVPMQVYNQEIIPLLQAQITAYQAGVRRLPGLSGSPVNIPKKTGASVAYWVSENTTVTNSDLTLGQVSMTPHAVASLVKLSNRLINISNPAAEQIVREQIAYDVGLAIDAAIYNGSGAAGQPTGICQTSGINTVGSFGSMAASTAYDKFLTMQQELAVDNALFGSPAWVMNSVAYFTAQKMVDPSATKQLERRLFSASPLGAMQFLGYPVIISNNLPTLTGSNTDNTVIFGNFAQCMLGEWGTMVLRSSDTAGNAFERMQTFVMAAMEVDVAVAQPTAFCSALAATT